MTALIGGHEVVPDGRRARADQFSLGGRVRIRAVPRPAVRRREQLLAVDDRHDAVVADTPGRVDAVADDIVAGGDPRIGPRGQCLRRLRMLVRGDRAMERWRHRARRARLGARQAERADVDGRGIRILPVVYEQRLRLSPQRGSILAARCEHEAGVAFPPLLVRGADADQRGGHDRRAHIGHVPDLIAGRSAALDIALQVHLLVIRIAGELRTEAHACHLRLTAGRRRDQRFLDRVAWIGDVDDHRAVVLAGAAVQRIRQEPRGAAGDPSGYGGDAAVHPHEQDSPSVGVLDHVRLIGRTALQVRMSQPVHVHFFVALIRRLRAGGAKRQRRGRCHRLDSCVADSIECVHRFLLW